MKSVYLFLVIFVLPLAAQTFSSGSTGSDGPLDLAAGDRVVQLPDSGVLNYTTINVPSGRTLSFMNNLRNSAAILLAQGAVVVSGTVLVSAPGRTLGPGGFFGGAPGQPGFGPGGGVTDFNSPQRNGSWVGPLHSFRTSEVLAVEELHYVDPPLRW